MNSASAGFSGNSSFASDAASSAAAVGAATGAGSGTPVTANVSITPDSVWPYPDNAIASTLETGFPGLKVYQQPKGEADMAVAAASILARDAFVEVMDQLSAQAGFPLPKGGGDQATAAARKLVREQGKDVLEQYVKLHFANTGKL